MTDKKQNQITENTATPVIHVAPSPHLSESGLTTQKIMLDVLIALAPLVLTSVIVFKLYAIKQLAICLVCCLGAETVFVRMRNKTVTLDDYSAAITAVILALSLPATAPWYVAAIASVVAIGIGKIIFGGLGMNIFNPAMVGRAFVMIAFASLMGASAFESSGCSVDVLTQATPMDAFKQAGVIASLSELFWGMTNGSLGETSAFACIIGGLYLCIRRTASWEIPAGVLLSVLILGGITDLITCNQWTVVHHIFGGALLFGAFFIATDPVTSPLTPKGKFIFGLGVGAFVMLIRIFSGYPEGVMFAVLLMNALTPLINRWTVPEPLGA